MKSKLWLALIAGFAFACSEKAPDKPAPAPAPKVAAAKPAEPAKPVEAAPATQAKAAARLNCTGTCDVDVTVTESGGNCSLALSSDEVHVQKAANATNIKWQLKGEPGYIFNTTPGGIVWGQPNKGPAPPTSVMTNGQGGGAAITITDNHTSDTSKGHWNYSVFVKKASGSTACQIDPSVDNE